MLTLVYRNGICTKVEKENTPKDVVAACDTAQRVVICQVSAVIVAHLADGSTLYYYGMRESDINSLYTHLLAPYSQVGEKDDTDLFVDKVQVVLDNFADRLRSYLRK